MRASVWICIAALAGVLALAASAPARLRNGVSQTPPLGTPSFAGCDSAEEWQSEWHPSVQGASSEVRATYRCGGQQMHVFTGQFIDPSGGAEAFSETQRVIPMVWTTHSTSTSTRIAADFEVNEHRLAVGERELRVLSWYAVGGEHYRSRWGAKLAEVLDAVRLRPRPAAVLAVAAEDSVGAEQLSRQADALWQWYRARLEQQREASS